MTVVLDPLSSIMVVTGGDLCKKVLPVKTLRAALIEELLIMASCNGEKGIAHKETAMTNQETENHGDSSSIARLLTAETVSSILGISPKTVHKLVREQKLACVQVTSRERRFTPEQVQEYIRSQSTPIRVDKKDRRSVQSHPKKGGAKSSGNTVRAQLKEEMRSWR